MNIWQAMVETDRALYRAYHVAEKAHIERLKKIPRPVNPLRAMIYDMELIPRFPMPAPTQEDAE